MSEIASDVCVVGAGIVGLAHALEARSRGLQVTVLERCDRAVGASVRNFGHGCVAAMADGMPLDCALDARARWIELAEQAGIELSLAGTLVLARDEDELAVLDEVATDERRGAVVLGPREVAELAPIQTEALLGALHARLDFRVDPRSAVSRLAALLERDPGARVLWQAPVHEVAEGFVSSSRAVVRAPLVILCPGPDFDTLPPDVRPLRDGLELCRLQMLRARLPRARHLGPALLTGLSLLRYPGFTAAAGAGAVRERFERERPELLEAGIHLIVTQLPDGDLIVGDSHSYGRTVSPFADERIFQLLLDEASRVLGPGLEVRERWQGVYPTAPGDPFLVEAPLRGVRVVEVVSGVGMTTALGLARRVVEDLVEAAQPAAADRGS